METVDGVYASAANRVMDEAATFQRIQEALAREQAAAAGAGSSVMGHTAEITPTQP